MILTDTIIDGMEKWECPECGCAYLLHWPPEYCKIILRVGDERAIHSGRKLDPYLAPFESWILSTSWNTDIRAG